MDTNESHFTLPEAPKKPKLSVRLKQKGILRPYTIATAVLFGCAGARICTGPFFGPRLRSSGRGILAGASIHTGEADLVDPLFRSPRRSSSPCRFWRRRTSSTQPRAEPFGFPARVLELLDAADLRNLPPAFLFLSGLRPLLFSKRAGYESGLQAGGGLGGDLRDCAVWLSGEITAIEDQIAYGASGHSYMPYSYYEMTGKLNDAFAAYAEKGGLHLVVPRVGQTWLCCRSR